MLKKIPITIAAVSLVQAAQLHQDDESNVQLAEDSEWNASIADSKPAKDADVEIKSDVSTSKKHEHHKSKHHKNKKHHENKEKSLVQKDEKSVPAKLGQKDKQSIPACTSVDCKKDSAADKWNLPTASPELAPHQNYGEPPSNSSPPLNPRLSQKEGGDKSIPACTSIGCKTESIAKPPKPDYPIDYKVPNNGMDHDIEHSIKNLKDAEAVLGPMKLPDDDKPKADAKIQLESIPACSSAECKTGTAAPKTAEQLDKHPIDYKVNDFGVDKDIMATQKHLQEMEKKFGKWDIPKKEDGPKYPVNYSVPNFGADNDMDSTQKSLEQAEKSLKTKWVVTKDQLVQSAVDLHLEKSAQPASDPIHGSGGCTTYNSDGSLGGKCKSEEEKSAHPINYPVPNLGLDKDIKDSQQHLKDAETTLGHELNVTAPAAKLKKSAAPSKVSTLATKSELHIKDDPICGSGGCVKIKNPLDKGPEYPMGYSVPDFGVDHDVKATQDHTKQTEAALGIDWNPKQNKDGSWDVPTAEAEFHLTGTKADIHLKDDPICGSGGCVKIKNPLDKGPEYPMGYSVPDFGVDHDVKATQDHTKQTEAALGVDWNPKQNKDGSWDVPTAEAEFHLTGTKADVHLKDNWKPDELDDKWIAPTADHLTGTKSEIHLKDDPVCLSTGCETRHSNPDDANWTKIGYSPLDTPLDKDMQDSQASDKTAQAETGKEWSILQTANEVHAKSEAKSAVKAKSSQKSAVKAKTEAKTKAKTETKTKVAAKSKAKAKTETKQKVEVKAAAKSEAQTEAKATIATSTTTHLQTRAEKSQEFAALREKMMNNWGFKS